MGEMPETRMMEARSFLIEKGYAESDFAADYWTYPHPGLGARIDKSSKTIVDYMTDLCAKFGVQGAILDVGAGAGNVVQGLRAAGMEAQGCEFSASGRELAKERYGINLLPCDLRGKLPYQDDGFNWATCIGVLSMIPDNFLKNAVCEILRVTRIGVLINVQTVISTEPDFWKNPHHLTSKSHLEYHRLLISCGAHDVTSIQPPQKKKYGIGMLDEFAGLFSKRAIAEL